MLILNNTTMAIRAMLRRPLRTFLVLQGVIWAAAIIVFPSAVEKGSIHNAIRNASRFKTDQITVRAYEKPGTEKLAVSDIEAIEKALKGRKYSVTPFRTRSGEAFAASRIIKTMLVGTDETSPGTRSFYASKGRYLTAEDVKEKRRVCVLEASAAEKLFPQRSALNKQVVVRCGEKLLTLRVVGVMEKRDAERLATDEQGFRRESPLGGKGGKFRTKWLKQMVEKMRFVMGIPSEYTGWKRSERCVHVPLSLLDQEGDAIDWLIVKTDPLGVMETAGRIQNVLVARNKEPVLLYNIFLPVLLSDQLNVKDDLTSALFLLCLFMGGIVIANIMLMSVMERHREIAIRRVEGASKRDIVWQFLTEGIVLCVTGALLGIPLGLGLAYIVSLYEPYAMSGIGIPLKDTFIALGCAVFLGTAAAILPARRAANLDPVVILQNE
ncbi:ABC transporter permease [bacterium]|nr:ABC transporter permease [bacterium]